MPTGKENIVEYFNKVAQRRLAMRKKHSYYWEEITEYCNYFSHETLSVLEIGCGTGELLHEIKGKRKVGIDFSPAMIEKAKSQFPGLEFRVMAAENIVLDEKFDLIILSNLIGFVDDVQVIFEQLHKVCHSRTRIIVTYYNHFWEPILKFAEFIGLKTKTPNQNWLTQNDIKNLLMLSGFDVYRRASRMILPVYIPLISSFFNNILAKLPLIKVFAMNNYSFAKPAAVDEPSDVTEKFSVSIIIPARNESGNIESGLLRIPGFGKWQEIIFVEGNSTDDTWEKINEIKKKYELSHKIKIAKQDGKGKADAVRKGFGIAEGDILMILDADLTVPPEDLPKFYDAIATGKGDFINGSRLVYQMEKEAMRFLNMLGNKFFSMAFSFLLDQPFKDTLCGTKVIFRADYEKLVTNRKFFGDFDPFGDYDLIFGAYKLNLKIVELPIRYRERTYGATNISRFKHGLILLRMCFFAARKIKFR
ncbi:MAG TPA: bifunctional class I SAM-dependent methyltransferase/glycosyltransferase family 2 protein [Bacteroidia bacterium]|nr:bifunctional class I SAM-dependent methyltransferase/glycosyltransferase family 2 protein [Bacteroidia bacterium]